MGELMTENPQWMFGLPKDLHRYLMLEFDRDNLNLE
jgi:hypothetical protein